MISANSGDVPKGLNLVSGEIEEVSQLGIYDNRHTK